MSSLVLFGVVAPWITVWLTPLWILGLGTSCGLLLSLALWGLLFLVKRSAAVEIPMFVREGPLWPMLIVFGLFSLVTIALTPVVDSPGEILSSLSRMTQVGTETHDFSIDSTEQATAKPIDVSFRRDELRTIQVESNTDISITATEQEDYSGRASFKISGGEDYSWRKGLPPSDPFANDENISQLYIWNTSGQTAAIRLTLQTTPVHPQVSTIPITALSVLGFFLIYFLQLAYLPKISAISLATAKSEMAQPLFLINVSLGVFLLILFIWIPYNTFGEDIKMLKDSGLTLIKVLSIIVALWAGGMSVAEEIDGRTALTVLAKPIRRREFILGKFFGITWVVATMFVVLGVVFLITLAYKPIYDSGESSALPPIWQQCHQETVGTVPGLVLGFFETVVLVSLSVAISTRLPMLANFIICTSIYALGHLTAKIVQSSIATEGLETVVFFGKFLATILPVLENFDIQPAIAGGRPVPLEYLGTALIYCILYSTVAMLLALALFEDRDLA